MNDLGLGSQPFTSIGTSAQPFSGAFDGNGHRISGLKIDSPFVDNLGLFGVTSNAAIKKLTLSIIDLNGAHNVGALIGLMNGGTVENCSVINVKRILGVQNFGGIVGKQQGACSIISSGIANFTISPDTATKTVAVSQGKNLLITLSDAEVQYNQTAAYTFSYNPSQASLVDLAAQTEAKDIGAGRIADTYLTITGMNSASGLVKFTVNKSGPDGLAYSGVVAMVELKPLLTGSLTVKYQMN